MRATRFCAYAQPPHTPQNAINANTSVVAHSVRTVALRSTREATNRRDMPIRLPLKQTSPSLSIARSPHRVPRESAYVDRDVGNPNVGSLHVDLHVRGPDDGSGDRRRLDAGGPNTCDLDARGLDARGLDAGSLDATGGDVRAAALLKLQGSSGKAKLP